MQSRESGPNPRRSDQEILGVPQSERKAVKHPALIGPSRLFTLLCTTAERPSLPQTCPYPPSQLTENPWCDDSQENAEQARSAHAPAGAPAAGCVARHWSLGQLRERRAEAGDS